MIFDRLSVLLGLFGRHNRAAVAFARRWSAVLARHPELQNDLIRLGGVFVLPAVNMVDGVPEPVTLDPYLCGLAAGRRELATQLLAAGGLSVEDLNQLMEDQDGCIS